MVKYFVTSDIHSFYKEFLTALHHKGFELNNPDHKIIVCGDLFDRGDQTVELFDFIKEMHTENRLVYIRGNHEDLLFDCATQMKLGTYPSEHHFSNGTVKTVSHLIGTHPAICATGDLYKTIDFSLLDEVLDFIDDVCVDYFELPTTIFVHGWIPCITQDFPSWYKERRKYIFNKDWRNASTVAWNFARWFNGMELAENGIVVPDKDVICGHWNTSWGHSRNGVCSEFGSDAKFTPFKAPGILAIDACTAYSHLVNCVVVDAQGKLIDC